MQGGDRLLSGRGAARCAPGRARRGKAACKAAPGAVLLHSLQERTEQQDQHVLNVGSRASAKQTRKRAGTDKHRRERAAAACARLGQCAWPRSAARSGAPARPAAPRSCPAARLPPRRPRRRARLAAGPASRAARATPPPARQAPGSARTHTARLASNARPLQQQAQPHARSTHNCYLHSANPEFPNTAWHTAVLHRARATSCSVRRTCARCT